MAIPAKLSVGGTRRGLAAVPPVLLCAFLISGCGGSNSTAAAPASPSPTACSSWTGLDDLFSVTTWLRQMIGDEVIFGSGTPQAKKDGQAVVLYAEPLGGYWPDLPAQYARQLRNSVLPVASSPYKATPEQLNTVANDAQSLATQISQLCF